MKTWRIQSIPNKISKIGEKFGEFNAIQNLSDLDEALKNSKINSENSW